MARYLILDSEAITSLAFPSERGSSAKRAQAVLASAHRQAALIRIPAAVLVEVYHGKPRDAGIDRILGRIARIVPTGRSIARVAERLLREGGLDSSSAIDAIVVATAVRLGGGLIATNDPVDMSRLAGPFPNVKVVAI